MSDTYQLLWETYPKEVALLMAEPTIENWGASGTTSDFQYGNGYIIFDGEPTKIPTCFFKNEDSHLSIDMSNLETVKTLHYNAFYNSRKVWRVILPPNLTKIDSQGLRSLNITEISIPNTVTEIQSGAFHNCFVLRQLTMSDNIETIGDNAFNCCPSLQSIVLPNTIKSIGKEAFKYCISLADITIQAIEPPTVGENAFNRVTKPVNEEYKETGDKDLLKFGILRVPLESVEKYKAIKEYNDYFSDIIAI